MRGRSGRSAWAAAASSTTHFTLQKATTIPKGETCSPQKRVVALKQTVVKRGKKVTVVTKRVVTVQVCTKKK